jgi:hypothetical protein
VIEKQILAPARSVEAWEKGAAKRIAKWKGLLATDAKTGGNKIEFVHRNFADPLPSGDLRPAVSEFDDEEHTLGSDVVASYAMFAARLGHPVFLVPVTRAPWLANTQKMKLEQDLDAIALVDLDAILEADAAHHEPLLVPEDDDAPKFTREEKSDEKKELAAKIRAELVEAIREDLAEKWPSQVENLQAAKQVLELYDYEMSIDGLVEILLPGDDEPEGEKTEAIYLAACKLWGNPSADMISALYWFELLSVSWFMLDDEMRLTPEVGERIRLVFQTFGQLNGALPLLRKAAGLADA